MRRHRNNLWCLLAGHDWSWPEWPNFGLLNAAVCRRCSLIDTVRKEKS